MSLPRQGADNQVLFVIFFLVLFVILFPILFVILFLILFVILFLILFVILSVIFFLILFVIFFAFKVVIVVVTFPYRFHSSHSSYSHTARNACSGECRTRHSSRPPEHD